MSGIEQDKTLELPGTQPMTYQVVEDGTIQKTGTGVIDEALLTIYVNGQELATMMCSPIEPEALALGFLFNEGVITARDQVKVIHANIAGSAVDVLLKRTEFEPPRRIILTSGCGGITLQELTESYPPLATDYTVSPDVIHNRMRDLQAATALHDAVGGVHAAGFGDAERLLISTEDIGRHNAVDRLAGLALQSGISLGDGVILSSGRISSEMIGKVRRMKVPVVASLTSPTSISVRLAQAWNICLVGYVRRGLMRVYTYPERLGLSA
jgi:FdhD protein